MNIHDSEGLFNAALRMLDRGDMAAAEMMLRQATELAEEGSNLYAAGLAALMSIRGRHEESLELLNDHLSEFPEDPSLLVAFGITMDASGDSEAAEDAYREALASDPEHGGANHGLALVLKTKGELEEAQKLACKAFHSAPEHPGFALTACELLESTGDNELAFKVAELGALYNPDEEDLVRRAVEGALDRDLPERAWEVLQDSDPTNPWVAGWKATLMDLDGKEEEANALIDASMPHGAKDPNYLFLIACIYLRREDYEGTERLLLEILAIDPEHTGAYALKAELSLNGDDLEEAIEPLAKAYAGSQDALTGWELVSSYYSTGRYIDGLELAKKLKDDPDMPSVLYPTYAVLCHAALDELDEARDFLEEIPPEMAAAAIDEMAKHGGHTQAEVELKDLLVAIRDGPDDEDEEDLLELAFDHYRNRRYQDAMDMAEEFVSDEDPNRVHFAEMVVVLSATSLGQAELAEELRETLPEELLPVAVSALIEGMTGTELEKKLFEEWEDYIPEPEPEPVPEPEPELLEMNEEQLEELDPQEFEVVEVEVELDEDGNEIVRTESLPEGFELVDEEIVYVTEEEDQEPVEEVFYLEEGEELPDDDDEYEYEVVEVEEEDDEVAAAPADGWDGNQL